MEEFYRPIRRTQINKADPSTLVPPAFRLYCAQYRETYNLQVRGPLALKRRGNSDTGIIATAPLDREDLEALAAAVKTALDEIGQVTP